MNEPNERIFRSMRQIISYMEAHGVKPATVDGVSAGTSGCYVFFVTKNNTIRKFKLSHFGIKYVTRTTVDGFINHIYNFYN